MTAISTVKAKRVSSRVINRARPTSTVLSMTLAATTRCEAALNVSVTRKRLRRPANLQASLLRKARKRMRQLRAKLKRPSAAVRPRGRPPQRPLVRRNPQPRNPARNEPRQLLKRRKPRAMFTVTVKPDSLRRNRVASLRLAGVAGEDDARARTSKRQQLQQAKRIPTHPRTGKTKKSNR